MLNLKFSKILLTGGHGFLGCHVHEELLKNGAKKASISRPTSSELDLRSPANCRKAVRGKHLVIHLAANFDGIKYNLENAGEVFYDNAVMGLHLVESSRLAKVKKIVIAGTVSSYPKDAPIPFSEKDFWNGLPEAGNASYGLAKKLIAAQIIAYQLQYKFTGVNLLLANLYGPGDEFDLRHANVVASLIRQFTEAKENGTKEIIMWGSGRASREFLYVADAARAIVLAARRYDSPEPVNIGSGREVKIKTLAETIAKLVGFKGRLVWDKTKPEGQLRRVSDVSRALKEFGFVSQTGLKTGLKETIRWYQKNFVHKDIHGH
jgi:GDP-L-fucose synthase